MIAQRAAVVTPPRSRVDHDWRDDMPLRWVVWAV